jgi:pimeloyl-ACP methyl ester carboxylesterase
LSSDAAAAGIEVAVHGYPVGVPTAQLEDVALHYVECGTGPPVLLIAGIPAVADDWTPAAERLAAAGFRAIAYDNRGSGASTVTPAPYTTGQLATDAVGLLDALDIERAHVFGMSLGGMIAQEVALLAPERIDHLVLGCTHAGVRHAAPPRKEVGRAFALQTDDWGERMRTLSPFAFARDVDPALLDAFDPRRQQQAAR